MASIHKEIIIDASPDHVWDALRDFGALHTRLVPGFVTDTRLDGDARIVTFANGTVAREILVDCDDSEAAAGLCHRQRTHQAAQRLGAGVRRKRRPHPLRVDRRRAAERDRALYGRADGSGPARDAEGIGTQRRMTSAFLDALGADGPSADRAGKMDLYGRFVGSWDLDVRQFSEDGRERRRAGEWHFGWALEGRAIQDVWIVPPRGELRHGDAAANVQLVRHHAAGLRSRYRRLADSVDRSGDAEFPADDRPRGRRRHRAAGHAAGRPTGPLEFYRTSRQIRSSGAAKSRRTTGATWRVVTEFTAAPQASVIFLTDRLAALS